MSTSVLRSVFAVFAAMVAAAIAAVAVWYLLIVLAWLVSVLLCCIAAFVAGKYVYGHVAGADAQLPTIASIKARLFTRAA